MCGTSSRAEENEKDEVKEDLVSAASVVDPTWSPKMTYGPTSEVVEKAPAAVPDKSANMNNMFFVQPAVLKEKAGEKDLAFHQQHSTWPKAGRLQANSLGPE